MTSNTYEKICSKVFISFSISKPVSFSGLREVFFSVRMRVVLCVPTSAKVTAINQIANKITSFKKII